MSWSFNAIGNCLQIAGQVLTRNSKRPLSFPRIFKAVSREGKCKSNTLTFEDVFQVRPCNEQLQYSYGLSGRVSIVPGVQFQFLAVVSSTAHDPHISFTHWVEERPEIRSTERKRKCYVQAGDFWTLIKSSAQEMQLDSVIKPQVFVFKQLLRSSLSEVPDGRWSPWWRSELLQLRRARSFCLETFER